MPVLWLRRQVSLLPAAAGLDGAWGSARPAGLLLLRPLQAEFSSLRRRAGAGGRDQSGADAAGLFGGDVAAVCRRGRGCAEALRRSAGVGLDGAALHGRGRRAFAGATEGGADGRTDAAGAEVDGSTRSRPTSGVRGPGCVQRADARSRSEQGRASHALHGLAVHAGQRTHALPGRFRTGYAGGASASASAGVGHHPGERLDRGHRRRQRLGGSVAASSGRASDDDFGLVSRRRASVRLREGVARPRRRSTPAVADTRPRAFSTSKAARRCSRTCRH